MSKSIIVIIILFLFSIEINSQEINQNFWFNFGVSQAISENKKDYTNFGTNINWQSNELTHSAGLNLTRPLFHTEYWSSTWNYGIGYSLIWDDVIISSITIGPSLTFGETEVDDLNSKFYWGSGITINSQFYISPLFFIIPQFAIGVEPYFNYNFYESIKTKIPFIYGIRFGFNINDFE